MSKLHRTDKYKRMLTQLLRDDAINRAHSHTQQSMSTRQGSNGITNALNDEPDGGSNVLEVLSHRMDLVETALRNPFSALEAVHLQLRDPNADNDRSGTMADLPIKI